MHANITEAPAKSRTVGKAARKPSPHGVGFFQCRGQCSLYSYGRLIDTRRFENRAERQAIFKLWQKRYYYLTDRMIKLSLD
jgi:hypothetical protein